MLDSRSIGVPLSSGVIDGVLGAGALKSGRSSIRREAGAAVDARSLGVGSEGAQRFSRGQSVRPTRPDGINQPVVDARSLGAEAQRPFLIRKSIMESNTRRLQLDGAMSQSENPQDGNGVGRLRSVDREIYRKQPSRGENRFQQRAPHEETARYTGARMSDSPGRQRNIEKSYTERSIFPLRDPQDGNGVQRHTSTDMDSVQQHSPRNTSQPFRNRFPADKTKFQGRTMSGDDRLSPARPRRLGRPQASRYGGDAEPRTRKRGARQGSDGDRRPASKKEIWTPEEQQYLKEKAVRDSQFIVREYTPVEHSRQAFIGMAPATASSDDLGMSEILGERLLLARKYLDHEFIQWDSKEQKADVMAVVEKLKAVRAAAAGAKQQQNGDVVAEKAETTTGSLTTSSGNNNDGHQQAQSLMQKLIAGEYAKFKRLGDRDILGHVERHVQRNDSFYPADEKSLLEKVRSIMPAEQASRVGGRRARN